MPLVPRAELAEAIYDGITSRAIDMVDLEAILLDADGWVKQSTAAPAAKLRDKHGIGGNPQRYSMFTAEGNAALHAELTVLYGKLAAGYVTRPYIYDEIRAIQARVADAGHTEVRDTEVEWAIVDAINPILDRLNMNSIGRNW